MALLFILLLVFLLGFAVKALFYMYKITVELSYLKDQLSVKDTYIDNLLSEMRHMQNDIDNLRIYKS